jgi:hypothetical protein
MKRKKERVTVTVDRALIEAANSAIASGRATSLSAWVNHALVDFAAKERRLTAMSHVLAEYEAKHGPFTAEELEAQRRDDRQNATVVRGRSGTLKTKKRRAA